jgi:hypothetical protein
MDSEEAIRSGLLKAMKHYPLHVASGRAFMWVHENLSAELVDQVNVSLTKESVSVVIVYKHHNFDVDEDGERFDTFLFQKRTFCFQKQELWSD